MRILISSINFAPELVGIGKYNGELVQWLTERGHDVRVVTAPPYYPAWQVAVGYGGPWYRREVWHGARVWRCPIWVPRKVTGATRLLHLATFALSSLPVLLSHAFWRPQVVLCVEPPLFAAPGGLLCARLGMGRALLHVQDFEVDAAFDLGIIRSARVRRWVSGLESWLMRRFDGVSTISMKMLRRLESKGVEPERCLLFPNWADTDAVFPLDAPSPMRKALGIPDDAVVALYSGNIGLKQGLESVVDAARLLSGQPRLQFVIGGQGAGYAPLRERAADLPNIRWIPLQPIEELNNLLNCADIHLLPQRADAADLVMPSKLTGMLASGRPVVAGAHPDTQIWEAIQGCGIAVAPEDPKALADALLRLADDSGLRAAMGGEARKYAVTELSRGAVLARFERQILQRLGTP